MYRAALGKIHVQNIKNGLVLERFLFVCFVYVFILNRSIKEKRREKERTVGRREISLILRRVVFPVWLWFVVDFAIMERAERTVVVVVVVTDA